MGYPYPNDRDIIREQCGQYSAGYKYGYSKGLLIGREKGINVGKQEILSEIEKLIEEYPNMVDLAYEVTRLVYQEKGDKND